MRICRRVIAAAVVPPLVWGLLAAGAYAEEPEASLRGQLQSLARTARMEILGLEWVGDAGSRAAAAGSVSDRLDHLLHDYSYVVTHGGGGQPQTVRILGPRQPLTEGRGEVAVRTERRGAHHLVAVTVQGRPGSRSDVVTMMIDTGASTLVLPESFAPRLGLRAQDLTDGTALTAAGPMTVRLGTLALVAVGQAQARGVAVAFVDDQRLGGQALLGMSFLERFQVTLEDQVDRLILVAR